MNSGSSVAAAPTRVVAAMVAKAARVNAITGTTIEPNQRDFVVCCFCVMTAHGTNLRPTNLCETNTGS
ncbi:MAG: hypothetical protein H6512_06615 [Acidimicrobiia bacterium]|nr:hypothetical protein [Acidimicrobiia bacterium]